LGYFIHVHLKVQNIKLGEKVGFTVSNILPFLIN
jgi:hypothetical protein